MGQALYRKYRSRKLSEIVGQEHVTTLLSNALKSGRIAHAYLFTGPRGVGKTSIARIFAHEINKLTYKQESTHLDIIEIDAASNNGVDDIRELREKVRVAPASADKKVYIIDEVHMLSKAAFNALLKTLEEPPAHVVFILATTDAEKLPETIISRTQRYTFHRATAEGIIKNLKRIAKDESITITDDALALIAEHSDGSFRDSVSLFDQLASLTDEKITATLVEQSLGLAAKERIEKLIHACIEKNFASLVQELQELEANGYQASIIARQLVSYIISHANKYPQLLSLVDKLLQTAGSPLPSASLLATLGGHVAEKQPVKSAQTAVSTPKKSERIIELEKKAEEAHPKDNLVKQKVAPSTPSPSTIAAGSEIDLDWQAIVAESKTKSIALHSILQKCGATATEGNIAVIYARNSFYVKKLESAKHKKTLHGLFKQLTGLDWTIELIPSVAPPKDSKIAAITAMMGGGEEVILESKE